MHYTYTNRQKRPGWVMETTLTKGHNGLHPWSLVGESDNGFHEFLNIRVAALIVWIIEVLQK